MEISNLIGKNIKKFRKLRGLTQEQLAEQAGLETKHICRLESGRHLPNIKTLYSILSVLKINYDDIGLGLSKNSNSAACSPFYTNALHILDAADEREIEYYCGVLEQAQKGIDIIQRK